MLLQCSIFDRSIQVIIIRTMSYILHYKKRPEKGCSSSSDIKLKPELFWGGQKEKKFAGSYFGLFAPKSFSWFSNKCCRSLRRLLFFLQLSKRSWLCSRSRIDRKKVKVCEEAMKALQMGNKNRLRRGSGCGAVGRAAASDPRDLLLESQQSKIFSS